VELYQVKYFLALCETLNFARAADRCHVSQPSLTRAVQKLEQELGGLLIRRERRSTHLTELGKLMRPMLEEVCGQLERTKSHAQRHVSGGRQTLKLGFLPSIGPLRLAPVLARFSRENPGVELRLSEATLPVLSDLLFSGELDAAVIAYAKRVDKHLRYFPLYTERLVCAAPWGHPFERFEAVRLSDLRDQAFLWRSNCENADLLLETCRQQGFELRIVYRSAGRLDPGDGRRGLRRHHHSGILAKRLRARYEAADRSESRSRALARHCGRTTAWETRRVDLACAPHLQLEPV